MRDKAGQLALDEYINHIRVQLYGPFWVRRRIADEIRSHLEDTVEDLAAAGMEPQQAAAVAIDRFGSPSLVARSFAQSKGQLLLAAGLIAMYRRARGHLGRPGLIGFQLMVGGFVISMISGALWFTAGAVGGLVIMLGGIVAYLSALLRTGDLPRFAVGLLLASVVAALVVGSAGMLMDIDTGTIATGAAAVLGTAGMGWIGLFLWSEKGTEDCNSQLEVAIA